MKVIEFDASDILREMMTDGIFDKGEYIPLNKLNAPSIDEFVKLIPDLRGGLILSLRPYQENVITTNTALVLMGDLDIDGTQVSSNNMIQQNSVVQVKNLSASPALLLVFHTQTDISLLTKPKPVNPNLKLILISDFVAAEQCKMIRESLYSHTDALAGLYGAAPDIKLRNTKYVQTTNPKLVQKTIHQIVTQVVEDFYDVAMECWEDPSLLKYPPGGLFKPHNDAEINDPDLPGGKAKLSNRDYTLIVFLNDDYTGGELSFPNYNIVAKPKVGRVVCFPSDSRFLHEARPVLEGYRYQLVTWLTSFGSVRNHNPEKHGPLPLFYKRTFENWSSFNG